MSEDESPDESTSPKTNGRSANRPWGEELEDEIPFHLFDIHLTEKKSRLAIKFTTTDGQIFAHAFMPDTDIDYIKTIVAAIINLKPKRLKQLYTTLKLMKEEQINEFKNDPHESLTLTIDSKLFLKRLGQFCEYQELVIPEYLCVTVKDSVTDSSKCVPVEFYNRSIDKPWDGGYRDTRTGIEYHNAFSQTGPRQQKRGPELMSCRDTQTNVDCRNRQVDMAYSQATQVGRSDLFIPTVTDRILSPQPYETSKQKQKRIDINGKVRILQRCYRSWKFLKCVKEMSQEYRLRVRLQKMMEDEELKNDEKRKRRDLICQMFPRSKMDFAMLYAMTEKWKKQEVAKISQMYCGPSKIAELALLSDAEVQVFQSIDKLQQEARRDAREQNDLNYLKQLGEPTTWYSSFNYLPVSCDTLENQQVRVLDELYQKVVDQKLSEPKKIDALSELKWLLHKDDCEIANDLRKLVDRAIGLLSRGFKNDSIKSLQKRIDSLLLHHFKRPECFESITRKRIKEKEEAMHSNLFVCTYCKELKTVNSFKLDARTEKINVCEACKWLDKTLEPWIDLSPYRFILKEVRRMERLLKSPSSVAYIIQDKDIYYLVTHIWHSHSAISECNSIYNLRFVRWQRDIDWSPWNCILLTVEEGKSHMKIWDLDEVYEEEFKNHIYNKLALAKKQFKQLTSIEGRFKKMYKLSSSDNLDPNTYNDFRKMYKVDRSKRLYY